MRVYNNLFNQIISPENLFLAWSRFKNSKGKKIDVLRFEQNLEPNIFQLYRELKARTYKHSGYTDFFISDPKRRHIYKASVRDRVLHHAIFQILTWVFEPTFIPHSFSCRIGRGTHKGVFAVEKMLRQQSRNYHRPCYALKCDIKKFFDSIDHTTLLAILAQKIKDRELMWLLEKIIESYPPKVASGGITRERESKNTPKIGVPIGNLTSQLFANVYLNEFDQFMKHELKVKHYARYTDDFVIIADDPAYLKNLLKPIETFLWGQLQLRLHPEKVTIRKFSQGIDFLGYVILPHYRILRARTRKRMWRKIKEKTKQYETGKIEKESLDQTIQSYLGVLSHSSSYQITKELKNQYWFWLRE